MDAVKNLLNRFSGGTVALRLPGTGPLGVSLPAIFLAMILLLGVGAGTVSSGESQKPLVVKEAENVSLPPVRPLPLERTLQWVVTIHFVNSQMEVVQLHYRVYEIGACTKPVMMLVETMKRKLAEKGFVYQPPKYLPEVPKKWLAISLAADSEYVKAKRDFRRKDGNLAVMVFQKNFLATVDVPVVEGEGMEYETIETLADEIVERLAFHSIA